MEKNSWQDLYEHAIAVCKEREVSEFMYAGSVAAAVLTDTGKIYTGISLDTACSIGYCAERNAIGTMLTDGETSITKVVAVKGTEVIMPCGVCREFMMQLGGQNRQMEVLTSLNPLKTITLAELIPDYWA
ncbi:cytidine deaminase family protein [Enterococcus sp. LJL120]